MKGTRKTKWTKSNAIHSFRGVVAHRSRGVLARHDWPISMLLSSFSLSVFVTLFVPVLDTNTDKRTAHHGDEVRQWASGTERKLVPCSINVQLWFHVEAFVFFKQLCRMCTMRVCMCIGADSPPPESSPVCLLSARESRKSVTFSLSLSLTLSLARVILRSVFRVRHEWEKFGEIHSKMNRLLALD